jgi:hypothetical protein
MLQRNPILEWFWKHGYEEPIGPLGPAISELAAERIHPAAEAWRTAVSQLVEAAQVKELAAKSSAAHQKSAMTKSANVCIEQILDEWCGTPSGRHPWPWPGPPPWAYQIASSLSLVANTLQAGSLRDELLAIAGQISSRAAESSQAART